MRITLRLLVKGLRFELAAVVLGALLLSGAALVVAAQLNAVAIPRDCLYASSTGPVAMPLKDDPAFEAHEAACQAKRQTFYTLDNDVAAQVMALMAPFPLLAGLLLGVPLVGREIEWGTAPLAWTLARSRRRWLLARALPLAVVLAIVLALPALTAEVLEGARDPLANPWTSFTDAGLRGPLLVGRGLLTFGLAVGVGALLGRQLPALIVAGVVAVLLLSAGDIARTEGTRGLATAVPSDATPTSGSLFVNQALRDQAGMLHPTSEIVIGSTGEVANGMELVTLIVPAAKAPLVDGTVAVAFGALGFLLIGGTALAVERRRAS
ncbi:MAG TPA: hypothetical protein VFW86_04200 [Candidatus Limnocylindrales bacterium]|nr:hypothetical protein [Candidatus Limnocylindrales bacterium]